MSDAASLSPKDNMTITSPAPVAAGFSCPDWMRAHTAALPTHVTDADERARIVNDLAARNIAEGTGGPFAALVVDRGTGEIVSIGVNLVMHAALAIAHAEIVALALAQTRLGAWNLGGGSGHLLVVNAQPCAMCLGALIWSGITAVEFAVPGADVERLTGFDEGPVPADWHDHLERRGISVEIGRMRQEAEAVLAAFRAKVDRGELPLYNGG